MSRIDTTSHKPPYVFEQVLKLGQKAYVLSGVALKKKRRVILVNVGMYNNHRMIRDFVKKSDLKFLSHEMIYYIHDIFESSKFIRGVLIQVNDDIGDRLKIFMSRYIAKVPNLKMRLYAGFLGILIVRKPFSDKDVFDMPFEDLENFDLTPLRKLPSLKKPVISIDVSDDSKETIDTSFETMDHDKILKEAPYEPWMKNSSIAIFFQNKELPSGLVEHYTKLKEATIDIEYDSEYVEGISTYTSSSFITINNMLRGFQDIYAASSHSVNKSVSLMHRLFKTVKPLPENFWTLRALKIDNPKEKKRYDNLKVGDYVVDTGFMSTSPKPYREDENFMRILVPKGSHVIFANDYSSFNEEFEVILPPGSVLKLLSEYVLPDGHRVRDFLYVGNIMDDVLSDFYKRLEDIDKMLTQLYDSIKPGDYVKDGGIVIDKVNKSERGLVLYDTAERDYTLFHMFKKHDVVADYKEVKEHVVEWDGGEFSENDIIVGNGSMRSTRILKVYDDAYFTASLNDMNIHVMNKNDLKSHFLTFRKGVFIVKNSPYAEPIESDMELAGGREGVIKAIREGFPLILFNIIYVRLGDDWLRIYVADNDALITVEDIHNIALTNDFSSLVDLKRHTIVVKDKPRKVTIEEAKQMPDKRFIVEIAESTYKLMHGRYIKDALNIYKISMP